MNKHKKSTYIIGTIIVVLAIFYAGTKYGESTQIKPTMSGFQGNGGRSGGRGFGMGQGMTMGDIVNIGDQSITLKTRDGSSKVVLISSSTPVTKSVPAQITELKAGDTISIVGKTNTDGSVVASEIQERNRLP